ncbi:MAG: RelA/SpoT family protein [Burkholderiales bacterium]
MSDIFELTQRVAGYLKHEDVAQFQEALRFSEQAHAGQFRASGEPYISHPIAVAGILADWRLDAQALIAAVLHDVIEDTETTTAQISEMFGKPVALLVDGVSKLDKIEFATKADAQAENFRKMLLAMAHDLRVILIKLADRLHNMRTLGAVPREKRKRIAQETLEIYAPIANRLGLHNVHNEFADLCFRHLYPTRYRVLAKAVNAARGNRQEALAKVRDAIDERLKAANIETTVAGREKNLYSIYRKMQEKSLTFSQVYDIYGFRVIVKDTSSCYLALGVLHGLYKPIPGTFNDYIAIPKGNGYQSLHTTLFGPFGTPIEIQIRSADMHRIAEAGVASHWSYKSGEKPSNEMQLKTNQWLQSLLQIQNESGDAAEFLEHIKVDLFPDDVYVFTPKGKIMALPRHATAVDFAYAVHTDVGNRCVAVKVNQELAPLRSELHNGDHVEIITAPHAQPNPAWLNYVVTGRARSHIRHYLKTMQYEQSIALGERMLDQALKAFQVDPKSIAATNWDKLLRETGIKNKQEVLADIGLGKRLNLVVARTLLAIGDTAHGERPHTSSVMIRGTEGMAVQLAKCCRPIPGDPIVGFTNKGKGLVVHTHDCPEIARYRNDPDKWLDVDWDPETKRLFEVRIKLTVANQRGVLAKVAATISAAGSNIENVSMEEEDGSAYTSLFFTLKIENRVKLETVMRDLRHVPEVVRIARVKG